MDEGPQEKKPIDDSRKPWKTAGARDPRDFYRKALRGLKQVNPAGYEKAVAHFQDVLVPSIAAGEAEPLWAWREYGRLIAEVTVHGRTVAVDETGDPSPSTRTHPWTGWSSISQTQRGKSHPGFPSPDPLPGSKGHRMSYWLWETPAFRNTRLNAPGQRCLTWSTVDPLHGGHQRRPHRAVGWVIKLTTTVAARARKKAGMSS